MIAEVRFSTVSMSLCMWIVQHQRPLTPILPARGVSHGIVIPKPFDICEAGSHIIRIWVDSGWITINRDGMSSIIRVIRYVCGHEW